MQRKSSGPGSRFFLPLPWATLDRHGPHTLLAAAVLLTLLSGCTGTPATTTSGTTLPYAGVRLTVACPGEPALSLVRHHGRRWASRTGAVVEVVAYDPATGPEAVAAADIWVIEMAALPRWAEAGRLRPVPEQYRQPHGEFDWQDLLEISTDRLLRWKDQAWALPLLGESPLCFYRSDLFNDRAYGEAFRKQYQRDLAPPTTWEDFADIAEFFSGHRQPGASTASLPPLAQDDAGLDREFHTIAASTAVRAVRLADRRDLDAAETFSFHRNLATGEPRLGSPGFVYALELMQRLQRCRAPADSRPPPEAFASGQAVLCLADATWIARFQKASPAPHFGIARVPGSRKVGDVRTGKLEEVPGGNYVPYLGATGALGVVLQTCRQADAAFALLADLAGKPTSAQVLFDERWGGAPLRRQHLEDAKGWSSFNLDQAQTNALLQALILTVTHPGLSNPATRLRQPDEREYAPVLAAELRAALSGEKDAARALEDAAARWRDIDRRKPEGQVRAYYAYSLGLIP